MNNPTPQITNTRLIELAKTYWAWRRLWIATTVAFGAFGLLYVLVLKTDMWIASQGLIVRDEANGAVMRLGRFQSQSDMKAAQETILEMARNSQVLREALLEVGPEKSLFTFGAMSKNWPTQREIAELADECIGVRAPKGAEFGTTEVIYLDIKQDSRDRAIALNRAVCSALDNRLRQVRVARADGVIDELVRASDMATGELKKATEQLQIIEREAGADLSDLRGLSEANGTGNTSRQLLDTIKTELRQQENQHKLLETDYSLLRETQVDPQRLLTAPASILNAHPGLKKLREGLADAQLNSSQLRGRFTSTHPLVYVATTSENEIKMQLQSELAVALATANKDVENSQSRIDSLKRQQKQVEERLERLARVRAGHDNLNQEVRSRTKILQEVERQLADARAARDAATSSSLLTRIDEPVLGERPVGPGRSTLLAAMTMAGLFFGLGIVFLLTPLDGQSPSQERWNERLGRRLSDRFPWLADQSPGGAPRRRQTDVDRRRAPAQLSQVLPMPLRRQSDQLWTGAGANEQAADGNRSGVRNMRAAQSQDLSADRSGDRSGDLSADSQDRSGVRGGKRSSDQLSDNVQSQIEAPLDSQAAFAATMSEQQHKPVVQVVDLDGLEKECDDAERRLLQPSPARSNSTDDNRQRQSAAASKLPAAIAPDMDTSPERMVTPVLASGLLSRAARAERAQERVEQPKDDLQIEPARTSSSQIAAEQSTSPEPSSSAAPIPSRVLGHLGSQTPAPPKTQFNGNASSDDRDSSTAPQKSASRSNDDPTLIARHEISQVQIAAIESMVEETKSLDAPAPRPSAPARSAPTTAQSQPMASSTNKAAPTQPRRVMNPTPTQPARPAPVSHSPNVSSAAPAVAPKPAMNASTPAPQQRQLPAPQPSSQQPTTQQPTTQQPTSQRPASPVAGKASAMPQPTRPAVPTSPQPFVNQPAAPQSIASAPNAVRPMDSRPMNAASAPQPSSMPGADMPGMNTHGMDSRVPARFTGRG